MTDQQAGSKTIVTARGDREIVSERVIDAPRERVFAAFTDPELVPHWYGPGNVTVRVEEMDVRVGGDYRFVCVNEDGSEDVFRGTIRELVPPERLVQTFEWLGMPGHIVVDSIVFEDLGGKTKVTNVSLFHTTEERDGMLASGMEDGMNQAYEQLEELLAREG
jgi:uncharacterized protein YndB with AHSA1/START domain